MKKNKRLEVKVCDQTTLTMYKIIFLTYLNISFFFSYVLQY